MLWYLEKKIALILETSFVGLSRVGAVTNARDLELI